MENKDKSQSDTVYDKLSNIVPEREIEGNDELDIDISGNQQSLGERMEYAPNLSDMQTADKRLFPDMGEKRKHLNILQVSRVFPDHYNPLLSMLVKDLLMNDPDLSVSEATTYAHTALSIAIDGEGRIDELQLLGGAIKTENEKTAAKLGL
jgi:hypothetical protein